MNNGVGIIDINVIIYIYIQFGQLVLKSTRVEVNIIKAYSSKKSDGAWVPIFTEVHLLKLWISYHYSTYWTYTFHITIRMTMYYTSTLHSLTCIVKLITSYWSHRLIGNLLSRKMIYVLQENIQVCELRGVVSQIHSNIYVLDDHFFENRYSVEDIEEASNISWRNYMNFPLSFWRMNSRVSPHTMSLISYHIIYFCTMGIDLRIEQITWFSKYRCIGWSLSRVAA